VPAAAGLQHGSGSQRARVGAGHRSRRHCRRMLRLAAWTAGQARAALRAPRHGGCCSRMRSAQLEAPHGELTCVVLHQAPAKPCNREVYRQVSGAVCAVILLHGLLKGKLAMCLLPTSGAALTAAARSCSSWHQQPTTRGVCPQDAPDGDPSAVSEEKSRSRARLQGGGGRGGWGG
jgi:hypothetical protein